VHSVNYYLVFLFVLFFGIKPICHWFESHGSDWVDEESSASTGTTGTGGNFDIHKDRPRIKNHA
jgi:hypothetical protein